MIHLLVHYTYEDNHTALNSKPLHNAKPVRGQHGSLTIVTSKTVGRNESVESCTIHSMRNDEIFMI